MAYEIVKERIISESLLYVRINHVYKTLGMFRGNVAEASELLEVDPTTIYRWMKEYGIAIDSCKQQVNWPWSERLRIA